MRDGVPLPGLTPAEVVSQLTYRVFGPLYPHWIRQVLDYHGLAGNPASTRGQVAVRHRVTTATVSNHVRAVRDAGVCLRLAEPVITSATRRSQPTQDHLARVRIAITLGLPRPEPPDPRRTPQPLGVPAYRSKVIWAAAQILAATGPLHLNTLLAAVERSRRFRDRTALQASDLADALASIGAGLDADGRWAAPPGVSPPDRYLILIDAAAGRDMTRAQMIETLLTAGYSRSSATGRMSTSHPLFQHVGPDRYRLIGPPATRSPTWSEPADRSPGR